MEKKEEEEKESVTIIYGNVCLRRLAGFGGVWGFLLITQFSLSSPFHLLRLSASTIDHLTSVHLFLSIDVLFHPLGEGASLRMDSTHNTIGYLHMGGWLALCVSPRHSSP